MHIKHILLFCLLGPVIFNTLAACAPTSIHDAGQAEEGNMENENKLAKVYEVKVSEDSLRFLTLSTGCTNASNFEVNVSYHTQESETITELAIHLVKPDYCKAMPRVVSITMPVEFIVKGELKVINPELELPNLKKRKRSGG